MPILDILSKLLATTTYQSICMWLHVRWWIFVCSFAGEINHELPSIINIDDRRDTTYKFIPTIINIDNMRCASISDMFVWPFYQPPSPPQLHDNQHICDYLEDGGLLDMCLMRKSNCYPSSHTICFYDHTDDRRDTLFRSSSILMIGDALL